MARNRREQSWLRLDEDLGKEYWNYHNSAANFAVANRHVIHKAVEDATWKVFKSKCEVYYEISHNLVQEETLVLPDGTHKKGFVHRKGATRAFPAGHPDLIGTQWEETGHPCLIPGSMYDGAAILFPKKGAFNVPDSATAALKNYRKDNETPLAFIEEKCAFDADDFVEKVELYQQYTQWCDEGRIRSVSRNKFNKTIQDYFKLIIERKTINGSRPHVWKGIKLKNSNR